MRTTTHLLHALTGGRAQSRALLRYGLAFVSVLAAMVATRLVGPPLVGMPLVVSAVLITASLGGIGPGLLAWLLSFVAIGFSSTPALPLDAEHLPALLLVSAATFLTGWVGTTRRRTLRSLRRARDELWARVEELRTFVDQATDAFFLLDEQLAVVDVNRQACESLGWSREEVIGMHPRDFDAALDEPSIARLAERVGTGETITFETRHRRKGGTVFPVEIRTSMFLQGGRRFYLALVRDISDRKRAADALQEKDDALQIARTELARVSRLTTLGELTTSIAHEVSQPLGAMVVSAAAGANWLAAEPPDIAGARSAFQEIAANGMWARDVIVRIRALTKRQAPRMELLDMNRTILEVVALTGHEVRSHDIVLQTQLDRTLPPVLGDRVELQQVLLNLIVNAIESMSGVHDRPRELTIVSAPDRPNAAVTVEVRDSGHGLEPERVKRVFEPFYTTKAEGVGIGLSISRSIVKAHGGRLWAGANEPHGAVFRFSLPVSSATTRLV